MLEDIMLHDIHVLASKAENILLRAANKGQKSSWKGLFEKVTQI